MANYEYLLFDVNTDGIGTITLNRPEELNALCWPLMEELEQLLKTAEKDPGVRVLIIKGAGRCFSVGYDFKETPPDEVRPGQGPATGEHEPRGVAAYGRGIWNSRAHVQGHVHYDQVVWNLWKPVIAQVHGYALAGASTLALACDLTVMAEDAKIGYPPSRWLATGDNVGLYSFVAGLKKAKEMSFGRQFTGKEAAEMGMINYSWPEAELEKNTREIARRIATIEPELLMLNKMVVNRVWEIIGIRTAMDVAGEFDSLCHMSNTAHQMREVLERSVSLAEGLRELNKPWGGV